MHTLKTLRDEVLSWLDESSNTTTTYTNVTNALNRAHQQRCTEQAWSFMLWHQAETFNLVVGQRRYILHQLLHKPLYVRNQTTKEYLIETPWRQMQAADPRWESATTGNRFVFVEPSQVAVQPTTAGVLTIVSTSTADNTTGKAIVVQGLSSGILVSETVVPNGTTPVSTSTSFDAGGILTVAKSAAWTGTFTLKSGSTTLLSLLPNELTRLYPQIELCWSPTTTDQIEYRFYRAPRELSADGDIPDLPQAYATLLVWDALIMFAAYDGDITQARLAAWSDQRDKLFTQLSIAYLDGSTVGAEPRYVRNMDDDGFSFPRVSN